MCSSVCAWWEAHYPLQAQHKPSIFKRRQKRWPVPVSGLPGRASAAGSSSPAPVQLPLCVLGHNEESSGGSWHRCAMGPGTWPETLPRVCAHVSPHTDLVFSLGRGLQGPPCRSTNNGVAQPPLCAASWLALARIIPFLSLNTTAEMSSLFCNAGICQLGGNKESIHWAGDRQRASGKALWGDRKCSSVKLWTPPELPFVFRSDQTGDRGLPCVDHVFSWGRRANSGLFFRMAD